MTEENRQQIPQKLAADRRKNNIKYTDATWHMSKAVSLSTMFGIAIVLIGGLFGAAEILGRVTTMETQLQIATDDRIHRTTVLEMFKSRDIQIEHLAEKIDGLSKEIEKTNTKIERSNDLLHQILIAMPKKITKSD